MQKIAVAVLNNKLSLHKALSLHIIKFHVMDNTIVRECFDGILETSDNLGDHRFTLCFKRRTFKNEN